VRGKSATLVMMAQIQFARGDHETALRNARESLRLLQAMGAAPDAAKVAKIVQQMEAALAGGASPQPAAFTPARLVGALIGAVVRVQRGQMPAADLRADLERLSAEATLTPITTALLAALWTALPTPPRRCWSLLSRCWLRAPPLNAPMRWRASATWRRCSMTTQRNCARVKRPWRPSARRVTIGNPW
jgi:hypothetical protein